MSEGHKNIEEYSDPGHLNHDKEKGPIDPNPANASPTPEEVGAKAENPESKQPPQKIGPWQTTINALLWMPPWCRYDEKNPPKFGLLLNILFAFAGTFTVCKTTAPLW